MNNVFNLPTLEEIIYLLDKILIKYTKKDKIINKESVPDDVWKTRDGRRISIKTMTDKHLINTLLYIKRKHIMINRMKIPTRRSKKVISWRDVMHPSMKKKFSIMEREAIKRGFADWESKHPIRE